jgi:hypothetical protein
MSVLYVDNNYWEEGYAQTGITIDWDDKIIFIPRSYMLEIQSTPTEIRQLDLNQFRLELKDLEDEVDGISFLDTHNHSPPVTVGGVTLARVIEIINGYTITFEDGQYAVNLLGANSNVADITNVNQVSVRSANSAGLTDLGSLQSSAYSGGVAIDTNSIYSGTNFPMGTRGFPVNNMDDAISIATARGLKTIYVTKDLYLLSGSYSTHQFTFVGNSIHTIMYIGESADAGYCEFQNLTLSGYLDAGTLMRECVVTNTVISNSTMFTSALVGPITFQGNQQCTMLQCFSALPTPITLDFNGASSGLICIIRGLIGDINIINCSQPVIADIGLSPGIISLDASVTVGVFNIHEESIISNSSTATVNDSTVFKHTADINWGLNTSAISSPGSIGEKIRKNLLR